METKYTAKEIFDYVVAVFRIDIKKYPKEFIKETIKEIENLIDNS